MIGRFPPLTTFIFSPLREVIQSAGLRKIGWDNRVENGKVMLHIAGCLGVG
jgi:hypothetical protein